MQQTTFSVVGLPAARSALYAALAGDAAAAQAPSVEVPLRDAGRGEDIVVTMTHGGGEHDLLLLLCAANRPESVRHIDDRVWALLDRTPHWQPVLLATVCDGEAPTPQFTTQLAQLTNRLDAQARYYGAVDLDVSGGEGSEGREQLFHGVSVCLDAVRSPTHVIWDRRAQALTAVGDRALRRAFWLLDKDVDGHLSDAEVLLWHNKMYAGTADEDIDGIKEHLRRTEADAECPGRLLSDRGVTAEGMLAVCHAMLTEAQQAAVWSLLWDTGVYQDGLPYAAADLDCVAVDPAEHVLQLSHNGVQFFGGLYSLKRFPAIEDMWAFTPECPWAEWGGLPLPGPELSQAAFLKCWRAVAARAPEAVIAFALYWGYKGDPALLFVAKPTRPLRTEDRHWPTTLTTVVIGSPGCGKSALIRRLSAARPEDTTHLEDSGNNPTLGAAAVPRDGQDITVVYAEVPDVDAAVEDPAFVARADCVLLCYDGNDPYSFSYLASVYAAISDRAPEIPAVVVMTKADLPIEDQVGEESPEQFCGRYHLAWPPVFTSCNAHCTQLGLRNDADTLSLMLADAIRCPDVTRVEAVTTARKLRRVAIVLVGATAVFLAARRLMRGRK